MVRPPRLARRSRRRDSDSDNNTDYTQCPELLALMYALNSVRRKIAKIKRGEVNSRKPCFCLTFKFYLTAIAHNRHGSLLRQTTLTTARLCSAQSWTSNAGSASSLEQCDAKRHTNPVTACETLERL